MTTAYHPSADGQSERTNATMETMLRYLLVEQCEVHHLQQVQHAQARIEELQQFNVRR